jgi:hypothetical protein
VLQVDDSETEEDPDAPWGEGTAGRSEGGKAASDSGVGADSQEALDGQADDDDEETTDEDERDEEDEALEEAAQAGAEGIGLWWAWAYNSRTGLRRSLGTDSLGRRYWLMAGRAGAYQVRSSAIGFMLSGCLYFCSFCLFYTLLKVACLVAGTVFAQHVQFLAV